MKKIEAKLPDQFQEIIHAPSEARKILGRDLEEKRLHRSFCKIFHAAEKRLGFRAFNVHFHKRHGLNVVFREIIIECDGLDGKRPAGRKVRSAQMRFFNMKARKSALIRNRAWVNRHGIFLFGRRTLQAFHHLRGGLKKMILDLSREKRHQAEAAKAKIGPQVKKMTAVF